MSEIAAARIRDVEARPIDRTGERKAKARTAMLHGPIIPTLAKLALPTIGVMVVQTMVGVAETYYLGFLGTDALAGVALVFPIFMLMTTMSNGGLGGGVASAVARAIGAGRQRDADALVFHSVVLAIIAGAIFTVGVLWAGPALYHALGGRGEALIAATRYSSWLFAAAIAVWIVNLLASALRGSGNVKVPALVTLVGAIVLIPSSPALIFGFGPIPRLGIAGAGIAFGLYYTGAMLVLLRYMRSGRSGLTLGVAQLERRLFADILKVGLPTAINAVQTNLCVILVTGAVGLFGTAALAGYGIASRLDYVMIPILFGLSSAVLTMVGVNIGAGKGGRARHIAWISALIGIGITGTIGLVAALAPSLWLGLFTDDPSVLAPGATYLRVVGLVYGLFGFGFVVSFAGQGAGTVLWPSVAVTARLIVAAGLGWAAVKILHGEMAMLSAIVALSLVVYATIASLVMLTPSAWRPRMA
ncbi:MATE family efflux transporter [Enhydrobacter sp.]|jgi:putative MATE family efflux protein|uniref:MATE family efflux transporter n=1 Tax=Enhydrobacter sp. TaxID=1894999 RepID=UPI00261E56D5|nr:MATE family efflux transporter [Enhydrobacter sp.]WIM11110.1 MAG: putative cation efflux pump [Enhydrobacter sp.]